ncbi:D-alanyl-D-alanine carboxypeptidase/D-alanyl-D-alanine-endopeptidase [Mesobacterium sp. TK19101]|uniref:D-alanyl-D-alanine carboxypeptidase/D-alanyl-D-alanine-endopeptidase n=1 Tax=Mesobacterium hydrothermale TaxID=3111907 RepID=A0ABU6HHY5_9RHOB|nr:D-alanyl-D-alanine carboxypeptidase/D-alanyl-D-alanine-endopeptidase [Mesobacterium sp. TK19101]MEC3862063.1 D-alanyl-D-alanine carboxypeptidase/D-alanyl-D-alanine-endopeptidase [Mesobacterium sp. TK19101]
MTYRISRRFFLTSAASFAALPACANAPDRSLRPEARGAGFHKKAVNGAEALVEKAELGGKVAFSVVDAQSGLVLEQREAQTGLPPASVAKALTACYALTVLGPGHHFVTRLIATGGVSGGVVQGDLVLAGGGDPTLDTDALAGLAARLKAAGVTGVKGRFLVWGGALPFVRGIDREQPDHVGYNPAVSGLNLNYNRVHFEWRKAGSGWNVTLDARSEKYRPDVRMARMEIVSRNVPIYTYKDAGGRDDWTVASGALGKGGARWLPVRKPELYAGEVFQTFAGAQGLRLPAPKLAQSLPDGAELARHESEPLRIVLRDMLKYSTNITAEAVGMTATIKRTGRPATLRASANEMNRWAKETLGMHDVALVDHSGLGDASRMTATDMTTALISAHRRMGIKAILKDIPMRDAKRKVIKDHPVKVHAKTGTLNFVSGLAGFIDATDGTEMAFAIFCADIPRRNKLTLAERERPDGAKGWNTRAKVLQQDLIDRWSVLYGS